MEQYEEKLKSYELEKYRNFIIFVTNHFLSLDSELVVISKDDFFGVKAPGRKYLFYTNIYQDGRYHFKFIETNWILDENSDLHSIWNKIKAFDLNEYKTREDLLLAISKNKMQKEAAPKQLNKMEDALNRLKDHLQGRDVKFSEVNLMPSKILKHLSAAGIDGYLSMVDAGYKNISSLNGVGKESLQVVIKVIDSFIKYDEYIQKIKQILLEGEIAVVDDGQLMQCHHAIVGIYSSIVKTSFDADIRILQAISQHFMGASVRKVAYRGGFAQDDFKKFVKSLADIFNYDISEVLDEMVSYDSKLVMTLLNIKAKNKIFYEFFVEGVLSNVLNFNVDLVLLRRIKEADIARPLDTKIVDTLDKFTGETDEDLFELLKLRREYLVKEKGPFMKYLFTNERLKDMATLRPVRYEEYINIKGCSSKSFFIGGKYFVELIKKFNDGEIDLSFMDKKVDDEDNKGDN